MNVTLHLTTGCNLACDYCYNPPTDRIDMPPEVLLRAVDLAMSDGRPSASLVFFGGEPLLRKDLVALAVAHAIEVGARRGVRPRFKVTTNGLLLDTEFIAFCADHGVMVGVSIDGCRESHDAHRASACGQGTFDRVARASRELLARLPYSLALAVVSPDGARSLDRSVAAILELGFRYAIVSLDHSADWGRRSLEDLREGYEELGEQYILRTRLEQKFYLSPFETRIASHVRPESTLEDRCHLGVRQVSVMPDGTIYPCVQFVRAGPASEFAIGSVERGIDLESRGTLYRRSRGEPSACLSCALRARCNHTCSCVNWQCTGDVCEVPGLLCAHERMLMPIVDRVAGTLFRVRSPMFLQKHYNAAYPLASLLDDLEPADAAGSTLP